jgi:two-component system sensor histidine kinase/response regulator
MARKIKSCSVSPGTQEPKDSGNNLLPENEVQALPGLDVQLGIARVMNNRILYREILELFRSNYADAAEKLNDLIRNENYSDAERLAHTLKGVSANLGAEKLRANAEHLEETLRMQNEGKVPRGMAEIAEGISGINEALSEVLVALEEYISVTCKSEQAGEPGDFCPAERKEAESPDTEKILSLTRDLRVLLQDNSFDAEKVTQELYEYLRQTPLAQNTEELKEHISRYDFAEGLKILDEIEHAVLTGMY